MWAHPALNLTALLALRPRQTNQCAGDKTIVGHCETISYNDITTSTTNPPSASECQDTCRGVLSDAGDWLVDFRGPLFHSSSIKFFGVVEVFVLTYFDITGKPAGYRQNMLGGPCGLSMGRAPGQPLNYTFDMHNQDLVDILYEVSKRFAPLHGGKVAAEGLIKCDGFEGAWRID